VSTSILEMEIFCGTYFEFWNLNMEDPLIDRYLWVVVSRTKLIEMIDEEWVVLEIDERKVFSIRNYWKFLRKKIAVALWKKLEDLYQDKSLVNKPFVYKKIVFLENGWWWFAIWAYAFNTIVNQLILFGLICMRSIIM